ncbi:hypothetical protein [Palleniella muris]|nr:hypothetical protein [Palleniella muris]
MTISKALVYHYLMSFFKGGCLANGVSGDEPVGFPSYSSGELCAIEPR